MPRTNVKAAQGKRKMPIVALVHDRSLMRYWLERSLRRDFRLRVFSSTEDALAFARATESLDALVTDLELTNSALGGCNIARDVRHRFPNALIFIISNASRDDHRIGILMGIKGIKFLSKPLGAFLLNRSLKKAFSKHEVSA